MEISRHEVRMMIRQELRPLHTNLYARVVAVDNAAQTVDVQPLVNKARPQAQNEDVVYSEYGVVPNVPLAFPRTARGALLLGVQVGDLVELRCAMHPLDELLTTDILDTVNPADTRMHDISDAVAVPVVLSNRPATSSGADAELVGDNVRLGRPTSGKLLVNSDFQTTLNNFTAAIRAAIDGAVSNLATANSLTPAAPSSLNAPTVPTTTHTRAS